MHFSDIIGKLGSNHIWRYFWIFLFLFICNHWLLLNFFPGLQIMQIWSIIYSLHFENVKIHKHCLYWKVFSTNIYRKIFSTVCCFFSYISWLVNCMSWVSKSNNFFWHARKLRQNLYLRVLSIVLYGKFISKSLILF